MFDFPYNAKALEHSMRLSDYVLAMMIGLAAVGGALACSLPLLLILLIIAKSLDVVVFLLVVIVSPCIEEALKFTPVALVFDDSKVFKAALISALVFSIIENIYYAGGLPIQADKYYLLLIRFLVSTPAHLLATGLVTHYYLEAKRGKNPLLMLSGVFFHSSFNFTVFYLVG